MKKIIALIITLISFSAFSQTGEKVYQGRLEAKNQNGGMIVLESKICNVQGVTYNSLRTIYSYGYDGSVNRGCWIFKNGMVNVVWESGKESMYSPSIFDPVYK